MTRKIEPYYGDLRVGDMVILRKLRGSPIETTVDEVIDDGRRAIVYRPDVGRWNIMKNSAGYWGSDGNMGLTELKQITDWKTHLEKRLTD